MLSQTKLARLMLCQKRYAKVTTFLVINNNSDYFTQEGREHRPFEIMQTNLSKRLSADWSTVRVQSRSDFKSLFSVSCRQKKHVCILVLPSRIGFFQQQKNQFLFDDNKYCSLYDKENLFMGKRATLIMGTPKKRNFFLQI